MIFSLGVMTGTSCDGADLAVLRFDRGGERLWKTASRDFPSKLRLRLREAQRGKLDIAETAALSRDYSAWIGSICRQALAGWKVPLRDTLIAVHGQTVWHAPERGISVQLLEPSLVSAITECTVTAAFRQPDLARGGEGAPLLPLYHWLRATAGRFAKELPLAVQNIGGIGNLTYVTKNRSKVLAFDTGPGNCLIDLATAAATNGRQLYDVDGRLARSALGSIDWRTIERIAREPYYRKAPPKSTGRELFNESYFRKIPGRGATRVANATALTAHTMARAYVDFLFKKGHRLRRILVAGGGARNPMLMILFRSELERMSGLELSVEVLPDDFAPAQFVEAMGFARFGYEALQGNPVSLASVTGAVTDGVGAGIFPGQNYRRLLKSLHMS